MWHSTPRPLDRCDRRVVEEGTAEGLRPLFRGQLGAVPLLFPSMGEGFGLPVEVMDPWA